jgi:hypothetical protein
MDEGRGVRADRKRRWLFFAFLLFGALAAASRADVIHLTDGRTVEGTIVDSSREWVELKSRYGTIRIPQKEIASIEAVVSKTEQYERMLREAKTLEDLERLVGWCDANDVPGSEARRRLDEAALRRKKEENPGWCRRCDARGIVPCEVCRGSGAVSEPCEACGHAGRIPCRTCPESSGRLTCPTCGGAQRIRAICRACNGAGRVSCHFCLGRGFLVCTACGGSGTRIETETVVVYDPQGRPVGTRQIERQVPCGTCGGRGSFFCGSCRGAGSVFCQACGASGTTVSVCPTCRGVATIACPTCKGARSLDCALCKDGFRSFPCRACGGKKKVRCVLCAGSGIATETPAPAAPQAVTATGR